MPRFPGRPIRGRRRRSIRTYVADDRRAAATATVATTHSEKPVIVYTDTLYSAFNVYLCRGYGNVKWTKEGIEVMAVISKKETVDGQLTEMMKGRKKVNGKVLRYYVLDADHIRSKMANEGYIEAVKPTVLSTHEHLDVMDDDLY